LYFGQRFLKAIKREQPFHAIIGGLC
jgi:hypothetical protein